VNTYLHIYIFVDNNDLIIGLLAIDFVSLWTNTHM